MLTITNVFNAQHGTVSLVNNEVTFTPDSNFNGVASFTYTVSDGNGGTAQATAILNIAAVNDAPVATGESTQTDEDIGLIFTQAQLLANDSDVDVLTNADVLRVGRVSDAQHGTAYIDAQGDIRFVPDANYHGPAQFTYWVTDLAGLEQPATVNIVIAAVNDIPVATGEQANSLEDRVLSIRTADLLANDSDADVATDGQVLTITNVFNAQHGTVELLDNGEIVFRPDSNFHGIASFSYTISDGNGGTAQATVALNIVPVNDAPVSNNDVLADQLEDSNLLITAAALLVNDTDADTAVDGDVLRIDSVTAIPGLTHGSISLDANGNVQFSPDANYAGPVVFSYVSSDGVGGLSSTSMVRFTVVNVNDAPVVGSDTLQVFEDNSITINPANLMANDTDADTPYGDSLTFAGVSNAQHGTVDLINGQIRFTPVPDFYGTAQFEYTVTDTQGVSTTGIARVNVTNVNDAPVVAGETINASEDQIQNILQSLLLNNDHDIDNPDGDLRIISVANDPNGATHGTVVLNANGTITYQPQLNYNGPAQFSYVVSDGSGGLATGTAILNIAGVNDAPSAVGETVSLLEDTPASFTVANLLANDQDVDNTNAQLFITGVDNAVGGTVVLINGSVVFTPLLNFNGAASFTYDVSDGAGGVSRATVAINYIPVNDAPIANSESIRGVEDQSLTIFAVALLLNDTDPESPATQLRISRVTAGAGCDGLFIDSNGNVQFFPTPNFNGLATFTYWVRDAEGLESATSATTSILVAAVNDAPTVQGEIVYGASEDAVFTISRSQLLANDYDIDNSTSGLRIEFNSGYYYGGYPSLNSNGDVIFTPNGNFNSTQSGYASFQYRLRDPAGAASEFVTVYIPVTEVNDVPLAVDERFSTYTNAVMTFSQSELLWNDSDADGDDLSITSVRNGVNGQVSILANGQVRFTPTLNFQGEASYEYLVDDGHGGQAWATSYVTVRVPPNQYPTLNPPASGVLGTVQPTYDKTQIRYGSNYLDINDDGDVNAVQIFFESASARLNGVTSSISANDSGASFNIPGRVMSWNVASWVNASRLMGGDNGQTSTPIYTDYYALGYTNQISITWKLIDDRGLVNYSTYSLDSASYNLTTGEYSYFVNNQYSGTFYPPVVIDLNGNGVEFKSLADSQVRFDLNHDGLKELIAWAANSDGILVWDKNGDKQISDASEFSFINLDPTAQTDLEGLRALDTNLNGLLDAGDEKFAEFSVWQDVNGNGITEEGEFKTLTDLGIASISLHSNGQVRDIGTDITVMGEAGFTRTDGSTGIVADAMFAHQPAGLKNEGTVTNQSITLPTAEEDAALLEQANILQMAAVFNQWVNTADTGSSSPIAYVPNDEPVSTDFDLIAAANSGQLVQGTNALPS